jgi:peptidoglycan/xylan/chitin deacetylase (PgdA/CDA1 family)
MSEQKPIASLSLDLDNKWSYMKTHGDRGWESYPSYLDVVVPRVLTLLQKRNCKITFFIVGQDAALEKNKAALRLISAAGHEIGCHSFRHEPWLHLYSAGEIESELALAEEHIERVTGQKPVGFRGPGFSFSEATLTTLARRGYLYDASTFPTFLGPLARAYYFFTAKLDKDETEQRKALFGKFREGFRPLHPYRWHTGAGELIEIPVTTMPLLKIPIHLSYLLYLGSYSPRIASLYLSLALGLCRLTRTSPSFLLHPLDFLGCEDEQDLAFFPAMGMPRARKLEQAGKVLDTIARHFTIVTMRQHAVEASSNALPVVSSLLNQTVE